MTRNSYRGLTLASLALILNGAGPGGTLAETAEQYLREELKSAGWEFSVPVLGDGEKIAFCRDVFVAGCKTLRRIPGALRMNANIIGLKQELILAADLHVHTVASGHAYSTVTEIAREAAHKGLSAVAITDHGPAMPGGTHRYYFGNMGVLPRMLEGVEILRGVELNILNEAGEVDLPPEYLALLDLAWAGLHVLCFDGSGTESYTRAVLNALKNPYIDGVVHPGNPDFPLDAEAVVRQARKHGKLVEINNSSFHVRLGSLEPCRRFAALVRDQGALVAVDSDAHFAGDVGRCEGAREVLAEAGLPHRQIINTSLDKVHNFLQARRERLNSI